MIATTTSKGELRRGWRPGAGLFGEVDVDYFAGGGGVALGFEVATGKCFDLAVNHDAAAIEMHAVNHPGTRHLRANVWEVDLEREIGRRPIRLFWASPDCRHFSRAKGATPVKKEIRGLAWVVIRVAKRKLPRIIMLENVREFMEWGPLVKVGVGADGKALWRPCPERKGLTFQKFVRGLKRLGYAVEWKVLDAAEYGAPTHRRRLFLIARRDGLPIVWPEKTHGGAAGDRGRYGGHGDQVGKGCASQKWPVGNSRRDGVRREGRNGAKRSRDLHCEDDKGCTPDRSRALSPFRTAAECIDWSIACPSIFDRKRPLAEKTCRRIAHGIVRYVLTAARPFIVPVNHGDGWKNAGARDRSIDRPAPTLTASRGEYLVAPSLAQVGWGEREGQAPRAMDADAPLGSVVAGGQKHALVSAFLSQYWGGMVGKPADRPLPTTTGKGPHEAIVAASIVRHCQNGSKGPGCADADAPLSTIVSKAEHSIAAAHLVKIRGESNGQSVDQPAPTITSGAGAARPAGAAHALGVAAACLTQFRGSNNGSGGDVAEPVPSITSQGRHAGLVLAFLSKYYGQGVGQDVADPLATATVKHRFGVVQVEVAPGEVVDAASVVIDGERFIITDIGLRMLTPRELARCQGFPDSYVLTGTQANQVAKIGNSVPPPVVSALVGANVGGGA